MKTKFKPGDLVLIDKDLLTQAVVGENWPQYIDYTKKHTIVLIDREMMWIHCDCIDNCDRRYWFGENTIHCLSLHKHTPKYSSFLQKLALLLLLLSTTTIYAESSQSSKMQKEVVRAIRSYPVTKDVEKRALHKGIKKVEDNTGLGYDGLKIVGAMGMTAIQGKISTKDIIIQKRIGDIKITPLVEYGFQKKETRGGVQINYEF